MTGPTAMKALAVFQLFAGIGVLMTIWTLGPFAFSIRSVAVLVLIALVLLSGPLLLLLGSLLVMFEKTRGSGGTFGLIGSVISSAWLLYIVANIVFGQPNRPLSKWETEVAVVLVLIIAAAIRLYLSVHGARHSRSDAR